MIIEVVIFGLPTQGGQVKMNTFLVFFRNVSSKNIFQKSSVWQIVSESSSSTKAAIYPTFFENKTKQNKKMGIDKSGQVPGYPFY